MKYAVILGDGMSDLPVAQLRGKTPLMCADKKYLDFLAANGEVGLVKTIPDSCYPGSDTANLSVMGYNPEVFYTGRSPLEAVSMGIELKDNDTAFRCNLVSLSDEKGYVNKTMLDYSADEISTEEAEQLISYAAEHLAGGDLKLYPGVSYRHCLVWEGFKGSPRFTAPHDITGKPIFGCMPQGEGAERLADIMSRSFELLDNHPINVRRRGRGLKPGNSLWFWGPGTKPALESYSDKFGVRGAMISAVDLLKGIALCAGMDNIDVEGATGNITTNFAGKGRAAADALLRGGFDFVYVHIEAPDECGHRKEVQNKIKSIELIDKHIAGTLYEALNASGEEFAIMVLPDHPTPVELGSHTRDPVPYIIYRSSGGTKSGAASYDELEAKKTGVFVEQGYTLMSRFIGQSFDK